MNIVVLNDSCEMDGGSARIALEDAHAMAERGHRVIFFSACGEPPRAASTIEWISLRQQNILSEKRRWLAASRGLWNFEVARALRKILLALPADNTVVHLHSWSKALSGSAVHVAHKHRFKIVGTLHDFFVVCPNGGLYDYPTRKACTLQPMSKSCMSQNCDSRAYAHKVWRVLRQMIWRRIAGIPQAFDCVVAVSDFSIKKIAKWLPRANVVEVIENLPIVLPCELRPLEQRAAIIYAGRVAAEKGVDLYLNACSLAKVQAEVCGDGPMLPELKAAWPQAQFAGWVPPQVLQQRIGKALALVVPSLCYETYGMIAAEAAAAGVAVIVSDHGAAATLVEDGVTGLHFRAGDAKDLAEKMTRLHADPQLAYAMGQVAYQRFWTGYDARKNQRIEKIENCYQKLLTMA